MRDQSRERRGWRQLALREWRQQVPRWRELPVEVRRDIVALLGRLLRDAGARREAGDE